jgi:hypothetical protein
MTPRSKQTFSHERKKPKKNPAKETSKEGFVQ